MKSDITIAVLAHVSDETLSDGNTGKVVFGRLEILEMILASLAAYNDVGAVPIAIFDTGDMDERKILERISRFGFHGIVKSSKEGFCAPVPGNGSRDFFRYGRTSRWSTEFRDKAMRFIESCGAAVTYALSRGSHYILAIEGDAVLFGRNYVERLIESLGEHTLASCTLRGKVQTDFWIANTPKMAPIVRELEGAMRPPYHSEDAFSEVFTDRVDLNDVFIGEKSLDQMLPSQTNGLGLEKDYFAEHKYSWITHPSQQQMAEVAEFLSLLPGTGVKRTGRFIFRRAGTLFRNALKEKLKGRIGRPR